MGRSYGQFPNRGPVEVSSISTAIAPAADASGAGSGPPPPIGWVQVQTAGSGGLVVKDESGTTRPYTGLAAGATLYGPFTELTSMTCSKILYGDGTAPPFTGGLAVAALYTDAQTTQGIITLSPQDFYLLTGAPLAIFANGASAVPGSALVDSQAFAVRWNNHATPNGILTSFRVPPDMDVTKNAIMHLRASKTGATSGDACTFDVACYNQVDALLDDADVNFGGTSGAMTGTATAKRIQNVTLTLALANLADPQVAPVSVTVSVTPTAGLLGTDDLCLFGVEITYTRKLLVS